MNAAPSRKPPEEKKEASKEKGGPRPFRKGEVIPDRFPQHDVLLAVHTAYHTVANKAYNDEMNPTRSLDHRVCDVEKHIREKLHELLLKKDMGVFIPLPKFWIGADKVADANHWVKGNHIKPYTLRSFAVGKKYDKCYAVYEMTDEGIRFENWYNHHRPRTEGEKQTAEAAIHVPPRGAGPVMVPNPNDVLSGRGPRISTHAGNVQFREIVAQRKEEYLSPATKKLEKKHIAASIVSHIRGLQPAGRFLKEDPDGLWYDIGDAKAIKKVGQALCEGVHDNAGGSKSRKGDGNGGDDTAARDSLEEDTKKRSDNKRSSMSFKIAAPDVAMTSGGGGGGWIRNISRRHHRQVARYSDSSFLTRRNQRLQLQSPSFVVDSQQQPSRSREFQQNHSSTSLYANFCHTDCTPTEVSGAAAATMRQQNGINDNVNNNDGFPGPEQRGMDEAFGRQFHAPPGASSIGDASLLSGLSGGRGSVLSGMSGISALTDHISAGSSVSGRADQQVRCLDQVQHHWQQQQQQQQQPASSHSSQVGAGLGSPLMQQLSVSEQQQRHQNLFGDTWDGLSWTGQHSPIGGGIMHGASSVGSTSFSELSDGINALDLAGFGGGGINVTYR